MFRTRFQIRLSLITVPHNIRIIRWENGHTHSTHSTADWCFFFREINVTKIFVKMISRKKNHLILGKLQFKKALFVSNFFVQSFFFEMLYYQRWFSRSRFFFIIFQKQCIWWFFKGENVNIIEEFEKIVKFGKIGENEANLTILLVYLKATFRIKKFHSVHWRIKVFLKNAIVKHLISLTNFFTKK